MVGPLLTFSFIVTALLTLVLFGFAKLFVNHRNTLGGLAAIVEGGVFVCVACLFYNLEWHFVIPSQVTSLWGGNGEIGFIVPSWLMTLFAVGGVFFSLEMAHKRFTGKPL